MKPEELVRQEDQLLAAILIQWGWVEKEKIEACVAQRKTMSMDGVKRRLGDLLQSEGVLSAEGIASAWETIGKAYSICRACGKAHPHFDAPPPPACPGCRSADLVPAGTAAAKPAALETVSDVPAELPVEEAGFVPAEEGEEVLLETASKEPEPEPRPEAAPEGAKGAAPAQAAGSGSDIDAKGGRSAATWPAEGGRPMAQPIATEGDKKYFGNYEIVKELKRGGMGIVYIARQKGLNREVALKVLLAGEGATEDQIQRFHREAEAAAKLSHPNIVPIFDVGVMGSQHYFTMEFVKGKPLDDAIKAKDLDEKKALIVIAKTARALDYAHERGIVHRDIKPGNVLLTEAGEPKLTDFGLAKDVGAASEGQHLTVSGAVMGTPMYMSPEQAEGRTREIGPRSDLFSLGAILYEILCGRPPFTGNTIVDILRKVTQDDPAPLRKLNKSVHKDVETICLKALEKPLDKRYQRCAEFADDIDRYLAGEPITAKPVSIQTRVAKKAKKYKAFLAMGVVFLVIAAAGVGALLVLQGRKAAENRRRHDESMMSGRQAFEAGDFQNAIQFFTQAGERLEGDPEAKDWQSKAEAAFAENQTKKDAETERKAQEEAARRAAAESREKFQSALAEAERALEAREFDKAKQAAAAAIALPASDEDRRKAGDLKSRIEAAQKAHEEEQRAGRLRELVEAAERLERDAEGILTGGKRDEAVQKFEAAREAWGKVLEAESGHAKASQRAEAIAVQRIGRIYLDLGQFSLARKALEKLPPDHADVRDLLAEIDRIEKSKGEYAVRLQKGRDAIAQKQWDEAIVFLQQAQQLNDTEEVQADLRRARGGQFASQAEAHRSAGKWDEALESLGKAAGIAADDQKAAFQEAETRLRAEASRDLLAKAKAEFDGGRLDAARPFAERSLKFLESPEARELLREILVDLEKPEDMACVKGGEFSVGSRDKEDNNPLRVVKILSFYMAVTETTNQEYLAFVEAGGYGKKEYWDEEAWKSVQKFVTAAGTGAAAAPGPATWVAGKPKELELNLPVTGVCWHEARAYARFRGRRLPTAEEWEVAASWDPKTRTHRKYPWGEDFDPKSPNRFANLSAPAPLPPGRTTTPDCSPCGCRDMAGNVTEWTVWKEDAKELGALKGESFKASAPEYYSRAIPVRRPGNLLVRLQTVGFRLAQDPGK